MKLMKLRPILEDLKSSTDVSYESFLQFYKQGKLDEDISKLIVVKNKIANKNYYVDEDNVENFKQLVKNKFE